MVLPPSPPGYPEPSTVPPSPPRYTRKFGVVQRLYGALRMPSETMRDIGLAPDYGGVAIILVLKFALMIAVVWIAVSKFHITGTYATEVTLILSGALIVVVIIGFFLVLLRWVVKSAIVWKACDEGSRWSFSSAAVVTGYAYIAEVLVAMIWVPVASLLLPVLHLDVSSLEAARQAVEAYQSQVMALYVYQIPVTLLALVWKSYLGGVGAHHGTRETCSKTMGIIVFFVLGLIGMIASFVGTFV